MFAGAPSSFLSRFPIRCLPILPLLQLSQIPKMSPISTAAVPSPLPYPPALRDDSVVDDYHGVRISDPYRWLEDPDADEVKEFVDRQSTLTDSVLAVCDLREKLRKEITALYDHPRYDTPFKRGKRYFYFHNTGLQAQSVLYVQSELDGEAEVLLDPNGLSEDGTVAISGPSISEDGEYLAHGLNSSGSDWMMIKVMRIADKKPEPDSLSWGNLQGKRRKRRNFQI